MLEENPKVGNTMTFDNEQERVILRDLIRSGLQHIGPHLQSPELMEVVTRTGLKFIDQLNEPLESE